jgi:DNA-binding NtrC family response regulator
MTNPEVGPREPEEVTPEQEKEKMRAMALAVDDDMSARMCAMDAGGDNMDVAKDVEGALKMLSERIYDVVFFDMNMPIKEGEKK